MTLCSLRRAAWQHECAVANLPAAERGHIHATVDSAASARETGADAASRGCSQAPGRASPAARAGCVCACARCGFARFFRVGPCACAMVHVMLCACARCEVSPDLFAPGFFVPKLSVHVPRIARVDPTIAIEMRVTSAARACGSPISAIIIIVDIVIIVSQHRRAKREPCNKCCDPPTFHHFLLLQAWPERTAQRLRFLRDATPRRGIHRSLEQLALR
jgi:hypothetical protein